MKKLYTLLITALAVSALNAQVNVTFSVDMNDEVVSDNGVHVAGSFQGWDPSGTPLTDDGNGVYSVTLSLEAGDYEFKFINGNDWPEEETVPGACQADQSGNTNRKITVGSEDMTYAVCYGSCAACGEYAVLFRVDMSLQEEVAPQGVHVAGNFQGWDPSGSPLAQVDGTDIYQALYTFDPAVLGEEALTFKYINGNDWPFPNENVPAECGDGGGNRLIELTEANTVLPAFCFNTCGSCVPPVAVTLQVDMSNETVSPNGVHVAGAFQNWQPGDTQMLDDDGDNIYEVVLNIAPGSYEYKFINGNNWDGENNDNESVPASCAVNGNRLLEVVEGEDQTVTFCYNQCTAECLTNPDPANVTFRVNMADEEVSADGVWLLGGFTSPQWQAGANQMLDDDGDGIYEVTLEVSGPAEMQYKFTNGDPYPNGNVDQTVEENYDFSIGLCGAPNGIGGFNRIHQRNGTPEELELVCYNSCVDCGQNVDQLDRDLGLALYPNPADEVLNFSTAEAQGLTELQVLDIQGRVLLSNSYTAVPGAVEQLELSTLPKGMYILQILNDGVITTSRFIKR